VLDCAQLQQLFETQFGHAPQVIARAPGRVNLIGEHTDYNEGFVFPLALMQNTWVAAGPRSDGQVCAHAIALDECVTVRLDEWKLDQTPHWFSYVGGVVKLLREQGGQAAVDLVIASDVPVGGGLSSSAAIELSTASALAALSGLEIAPRDLAMLARRAEHEYAGVPCGIMDQMISALAQEGHALLLDCRSEAFEQVPLPADSHEIVIVNSGVRHELASGEYAKRQAECKAAVAALQEQVDPAIQSLRGATLEQLNSLEGRVDPVAFKRARHVITENTRTVAAAEALKQGEWPRLGQLLVEAHSSIRDDYEVSCVEVDALVECVNAVAGVVGARMTGGGFGGCVVAFAEKGTASQIESAVRSGYDPKFGKHAELIVTKAGSGATVVSPAP
jgi:galactokinase